MPNFLVTCQVAEKAGLSSELTQKLLEMISSPAVKNRLKETTEEAVKYGVRCFQCLLVSQLRIPSLLRTLGSKEQRRWSLESTIETISLLLF